MFLGEGIGEWWDYGEVCMLKLPDDFVLGCTKRFCFWFEILDSLCQLDESYFYGDSLFAYA